MTLCRKCGKEIPDGKDLCDDCMNTTSDVETALDELLQSMGDVQPSVPVTATDEVPENIQEDILAEPVLEDIPAEMLEEMPTEPVEEAAAEGFDLPLDEIQFEETVEQEADAEPVLEDIPAEMPEEMPTEPVEEAAAEGFDLPLDEIQFEETVEQEADAEPILEDIPAEMPEEPILEEMPAEIPEEMLTEPVEEATAEGFDLPLDEIQFEEIVEQEADAEPILEEMPAEIPEEMLTEPVEEATAEGFDLPLDEIQFEETVEQEADAEPILEDIPAEIPEEMLTEPVLEDIPAEIPEEMPAEPVLEEIPEEIPEEPTINPEEEDLGALLDILSKDATTEEQPLFDDDSEVAEEIPDSPESTQAVLFDEDDGNIFADGIGNEPMPDMQEDGSQSDGATVNDIFQDALAAVEYSDDEEFALDELSSLDDEQMALEAENDGLDTSSDKPKKSATKKAKAKKEAKEKSGFLGKLFGNIVTETTAQEEAKARAEEELAIEQKKEDKEKKKQEAEAQKAEKAELAAQEKEKKAAQKAELAEKKAAQKEEKKRLKAERQAIEEAKVVGKINPIGAGIVLIFFGIILAIVLIGTNKFSFSHSLSVAKDSFDAGDYEAAYEAITGLEVSEENQELSGKIRICMQLQREMDSYNNYYKLGMYLESLDALMKGVKSYEEHKQDAYNYSIENQYDALKKSIVDALYNEFGVSEQTALELNKVEDREEYTNKLQEIISAWEQRNKLDEQ